MRMAAELTDYEMMVIFKPLLPDDVRKASHNTIIEKAKELGGEVIDADVWGKRYLAYPIKKHDEGYYIVYQISLPPAKLGEFQTVVGRVTEVLRYMVTRVDDPELTKKKLNKKVIDI